MWRLSVSTLCLCILLVIQYTAIEAKNKDKDKDTCGNTVCHNTWTAAGKNCFKIFTNLKTWDEAKKACKEKKAELVTLDRPWFYKKVACASQLAGSPRVWIGAKWDSTRTNGNQKYSWLGGKNLGIHDKHWVPGQPDFTRKEEKCVEMNWKVKDLWNDDRCSVKKGFICELKNLK